jgi:prepilin-type N-terminal cleavage/methylation domain-containing protein
MMHELKIKGENFKVGFTLIELLVVISIIGILATLIMARFGGVEKSARDAKRKSDLNQYRIAIENAASRTNGLYLYVMSETIAPTTFLCPYLVNYIASCIVDPRSPTYGYHYKSNGSGALGTDVNATIYVLWATLESVTLNPTYYVCSNGKIGQIGTGVEPSMGPGNNCE